VRDGKRIRLRGEDEVLNLPDEQRVCNIDGVEFGGRPGQRPMVLIGSMFFAGHRIVSDAVKGVFDKDKAKALLDLEAEVSETTGNPRCVDVIGETAPALIGYIDFVARNSSSPILVDSPFQSVRMAAIRHFSGSDVMKRLIYNSIAEDHTEEELACLRECGVQTSIILAFSTKAMKPDAKLRLLQEDLLPAAERAGIENVLIDVGVTDVPSVSWAAMATFRIKEELRLPAGCAPANAVYTWTKMKTRGRPAFEAAAGAMFSMTRLMGADFILYGSLQNAPWVYPAVATADGLIASAGRFTGVSVKSENHPLYKVF